MADPVTILVRPIVMIVLNQLSSSLTEEYLAFYGVRKEKERLESLLIEILALLKDVEESPRNSPLSSSLRVWLGKLRVAVYDAQDLLDSWTTEYKKWSMKKQVNKFLPPFSASNFGFQRRISRELKDIVARLDKILKQKYKCQPDGGGVLGTENSRLQTGSLVNNLVVSREKEKEDIVRLLVSGGEASEGENMIAVIPIVGMGGVGKTTLAQLVYEDDRIATYFKIRIWISVTDIFDLTRIFKDMVLSQNNDHDIGFLPFNQLQARVVDILARKRFLLVLDDIWNDNYLEWQQLENVLSRGGKGSRVLVTSRVSRVSDVMGAKAPYHLPCFDDAESWSLFENIVFKEGSSTANAREDLEAYGKGIVRKCKGLPLAVKQIGGLLRGIVDVQEWSRIMTELDEESNSESKSHKILPALKLSYDHLSFNLKQLFEYCSLFPKACVFDKSELIKLWMAEGFIVPNENERTEAIGGRYFDDLLNRFFFESSSDDKTKYRMHDLIHDLAKSVSSPQCCQVKDKKSSGVLKESRHVSVFREDVEQPVLEIIERSKKLHTLLFPVEHLKAFGQSLDKIFHSLRYLRVLDLSSSTILELPKSIKNLKQLRYLDLSKTDIRELPKSICKLYNLETLKLLVCPWLFELPSNLGALVNLRHLELDEMFWNKISMLPPRMGQLTSLHNLHTFHVCRIPGHGIEELKNMVYLTGTLSITKLENAVNPTKASLKDKEMVQKLEYVWSVGDVDLKDEADAKDVLEGLQPHINVRGLLIRRYRGTEFPTWMRNGLLRNLVTISLIHCTRSKILSLGKLPKLADLLLKNMLELEEWSEERYPSLQRLKISNCPKLRKLPCFFPKLEVLKIKKCESLDAIPLAQLINITLVDNHVLKHWPEDDLPVRFAYDNGQEETCQIASSAFLLDVKIINCPELRMLPTNLKADKLEISGCKSLSALPDDEHAQFLQHLALDACHDETLVGMIPTTNTLSSLVISNISNMVSLPKWSGLPGLKALYIRDCKDLEHLSNQENRSFQSFTSLELLSIRNCPKLVTLPVEGLPATLEYLSIASCASLKSFGPNDVFKNLTSLSDLYLEDCPELHALPEDGLSPSLQHLCIRRCHPLIERCQKEDGDRPMITNIPDLEIDIASTEIPSSTSTSAWYRLFRS